jgi:nucleotide-binding universal stress UspA family protein
MPATTGFDYSPKILVATDLTGRAELAVARAAQLAIRAGGSMDVLHVVDDIAEHLRAPFIERTHAALTQQVATAAGTAKLATDVRVVAGGSDATILAEARSTAADLIVCGSHRPRPGQERWLGSTMDRVLKSGDRPVLLVKTPPGGPYRKVTVGVDFSDFSARALGFAMRVAPGAEFILVHTFHVPYSGVPIPASLAGTVASGARAEERDHMQVWLAPFRPTAEKLGITFVPIIERGDPQKHVLETAAKHNADLLVVGTHGRTGLRHAILGSVAECLIAHAPMDVLVVR